MSTATKSAVALNLGKTEQCKMISFHFSMGIGRMRQIATKVINPITDAVGATDASVTNAITGQAVVVTTAQKSELRSQKRLIDSPELDLIRSMDGKLKRFIESQSAAAGQESTRFVLSTEVEAIWRAMEAYRTIRRPKLVADFMAKYRAAEAKDFADQKASLGDQFKRTDYPAANEVEQGFAFTYTIRNVGELELKGLPSFIVDMEREKEAASRATAVEDFKHLLRFTFKKVLDTLVDNIKPQFDGKRRSYSSVDTLLAFVSNYAKQDIANDAETQLLVSDIKNALHGVTPETLKESENQMAYVHATLSNVKEQLDSMIMVSGRKFR
jgi:hypothetical protein